MAGQVQHQYNFFEAVWYLNKIDIMTTRQKIIQTLKNRLKKEPTKNVFFFVSTKFITQCFLDPPTTQDFNLSLVYFLGK